MIVVLGMGLTGLSAAHHVNTACVILERETTPGGLCRTTHCNGFEFGYSGHLLHLRDGALRALLDAVLPESWPTHRRRAFVRSHDVLVPFPFQYHLHALPVAVRAECVSSYRRAHRARDASACETTTLQGSILRSYGEGITRHFFAPYHQKLWGSDLHTLLADETGWSIPEGEPGAVLRGALGPENRDLGYSALFQHPRRGGIGQLAGHLAEMLERRRPGTCRPGEAAVAVDLDERTVTTSKGNRIAFGTLVSTLPLPELVAITTPVPLPLRKLASALRYRSVACVNLGFARPRMVDWHWLYVPEPGVAFFRIGCYSNFSDAPGSSFYVEFARPGGTRPPGDLAGRALAGMRALGIVAQEEPLAVEVVDIPYAYVVHDRARRDALPRLRAFLGARGVHSIGRYGGWGYLSMEGAMLEGRRLAATLA